MPKAIWSGSVSFGLVNVPVKLVTAQSAKDVRFNQLHDKDGGRINQKRVCSVDGEEVDYAHIVKGYDVGGGRYVIIEPEELRSIDPESSRTIDIEEFVDLADIDPIYYERSYYLVPDERAWGGSSCGPSSTSRPFGPRTGCSSCRPCSTPTR
jgi:DNA end-binding protein Ku